MLADLMLFARPPKLKLEQIDLVQLADDVLSELSEEAALQQTTLHRPNRRDLLSIAADAVQLRVALRALCMNSLEAIGQNGNLTIDICVSDADIAGAPTSGDVVQIVVSDDGPGIPAEIRTKIFDPFFSGREAGRGLGFGLSKCWRIITLHGGRVEVNSPPGQGTTFTLVLPLSNEKSALPAESRSQHRLISLTLRRFSCNKKHSWGRLFLICQFEGAGRGVVRLRPKIVRLACVAAGSAGAS